MKGGINMTFTNHYKKIFLDVSTVCGVMLIFVVIYLQLGGIGYLTIRNIWQIVLLGAALVLRFESFVNFHGLSEGLMRLNYIITSVLADIALLVLLIYFTPGGKTFQNLGWGILVMYIISKGLIYTMVYIQALQNARKINDKLNRLNLD